VCMFESSIEDAPSTSEMVQIILNQATIVLFSAHNRSMSTGATSRTLRSLQWAWGPLSVPWGMGTLVYRLNFLDITGQPISDPKTA
jgi:hypothetical protein